METLNDTIAEHTAHYNNNNHNKNTFRRAMTYGEITPLGARQLFKTLGMTKRRRKSHPSRTNSCHFLDLGSGTGKLVIQAYLELPLTRSAVGIELVPSRHKTALQAWDEIQQQEDVVKNLYHESITTTNRTIQFIQGDLFQDINLSKATHIYIAYLLFSKDMMAQLEQKLAIEAIHLECVATLKPFPLGLLQHQHQPKQMDPSENKNKNKRNSPRQPAVEYVEMSWTKP